MGWSTMRGCRADNLSLWPFYKESRRHSSYVDTVTKYTDSIFLDMSYISCLALFQTSNSSRNRSAESTCVLSEATIAYIITVFLSRGVWGLDIFYNLPLAFTSGLNFTFDLRPSSTLFSPSLSPKWDHHYRCRAICLDVCSKIIFWRIIVLISLRRSSQNLRKEFDSCLRSSYIPWK